MSQKLRARERSHNGFPGIGVHTCPVTPIYLQTRRVSCWKILQPSVHAGCGTDLRGYMDSAFERALPMTAEIVLTLTPQQIQNIERRYAKINEEFNDEHLQRDESRRLKKSIKRTIERAEFFYGDLDKAQQAFIAQWVTRSPYEVNIWNAERHRRQQDLVQVLRRLNADNADPG